MKSDEVTSMILGCSVSGYYKWKKQNRPILKLLEMSFSKDELERFLETGEKPTKIEFADHYFYGLYDVFSHYIVENDGSKALFSAILKNGTNDIDNTILELHKNDILDSNDVISYFNQKPDKQLTLYIKENYKANWSSFKLSVSERGHEWLMLYFEIFLLSIEKNIYDMVFGRQDKKIYECLVPYPPSFFGVYTNMYRIQEKYINILNAVKKAIIDNNYEYLPKYDVCNGSFSMGTESLNLGDGSYFLKDEPSSNLESDSDHEGLQEILDQERGIPPRI